MTPPGPARPPPTPSPIRPATPTARPAMRARTRPSPASCGPAARSFSDSLASASACNSSDLRSPDAERLEDAGPAAIGTVPPCRAAMAVTASGTTHVAETRKARNSTTRLLLTGKPLPSVRHTRRPRIVRSTASRASWRYPRAAPKVHDHAYLGRARPAFPPCRSVSVLDGHRAPASLSAASHPDARPQPIPNEPRARASAGLMPRRVWRARASLIRGTPSSPANDDVQQLPRRRADGREARRACSSVRGTAMLRWSAAVAPPHLRAPVTSRTGIALRSCSCHTIARRPSGARSAAGAGGAARPPRQAKTSIGRPKVSPGRRTAAARPWHASCELRKPTPGEQRRAVVSADQRQRDGELVGSRDDLRGREHASARAVAYITWALARGMLEFWLRAKPP